MLASFLEHTSSFLLRTFSPVIFSLWQAFFLPLLPCGSLLHREAHNFLSEPVMVTPAGTPDGGNGGARGGGGELYCFNILLVIFFIIDKHLTLAHIYIYILIYI